MKPDVMLSSFGHMFAPHPEVAIKEMLRVTKSKGRIAFATLPPELANGMLFETIAKYMANFPLSAVNESSPTLWGILEVIHKRLGSSSVKNIHFERGVMN
jgi:hypothetical protein